MGCKRSQTLTSGSCAKCKPCKSLSYTAQDVMTAAESVLGQSSCWNSTSLSERDISIELPNILNWKGLKDYQIQLSSCRPEFPFAELPPYLSCSNKAQALLRYDRQHSVFHMTAQVCAFTMTSQLAEKMVEQYWSSSLPQFRAGALHSPRFILFGCQQELVIPSNGLGRKCQAKYGTIFITKVECFHDMLNSIPRWSYFVDVKFVKICI